MRTEQQIITFLRRLRTGRPAAGSTIVGIGDDAAVLRLSRDRDLIVTTDLFVEGVHFQSDWLSAHAAGRRVLGRALSDISAMGGRPHWAFLSLGLPQEFDSAWARRFLRGFAAAARQYRVLLVGEIPVPPARQSSWQTRSSAEACRGARRSCAPAHGPATPCLFPGGWEPQHARSTRGCRCQPSVHASCWASTFAAAAWLLP